MTEQQFKENLASFTGSEYLYKYIWGLKITEGVKFACETAKCFWLVDIIASYQNDKKIRGQEFQTWTLTVKNGKGYVAATDGNNNELISQHIPYTDFEYSRLTFWCVNNIVMLKTEY